MRSRPAVAKAYVMAGLGIAIVPTIAVDVTDTWLHAVDVTRLFPKSVITISVRQDLYPRRYLTDFIRMLVPNLSDLAIQKAIDA